MVHSRKNWKISMIYSRINGIDQLVDGVEGDACFGATVLTCQEEVENLHQQSRTTE